jgi:hypothetical protein
MPGLGSNAWGRRARAFRNAASGGSGLLNAPASNLGFFFVFFAFFVAKTH